MYERCLQKTATIVWLTSNGRHASILEQSDHGLIPRSQPSLARFVTCPWRGREWSLAPALSVSPLPQLLGRMHHVEEPMAVAITIWCILAVMMVISWVAWLFCWIMKTRTKTGP